MSRKAAASPDMKGEPLGMRGRSGPCSGSLRGGIGAGPHPARTWYLLVINGQGPLAWTPFPGSKQPGSGGGEQLRGSWYRQRLWALLLCGEAVAKRGKRPSYKLLVGEKWA